MSDIQKDDMSAVTKRLRDLALNGDGTASPYAPVLCSELFFLLNRITELALALGEACDIADRRGDTIDQLQWLATGRSAMPAEHEPRQGLTDRSSGRLLDLRKLIIG